MCRLGLRCDGSMGDGSLWWLFPFVLVFGSVVISLAFKWTGFLSGNKSLSRFSFLFWALVTAQTGIGYVGFLDRASAFEFSFPGLYIIVQSYSDTLNLHFWILVFKCAVLTLSGTVGRLYTTFSVLVFLYFR